MLEEANLTEFLIIDLPFVSLVAAGTDHSFAVTSKGKAYSWGFADSGRTGHDVEADVEIPTLINSKPVREKKLIFAGAGGSFSILASAAQDE